DDFLIDRVGPDSNTSTQFWDLELNWQDLTNGGCHVKVHKGDHVLVAYNAFGKPLLKLTGPKHAHAGQAFTVKVVNGRNGDAVEGAKVGGHKTNSKGKATLVVSKTGKLRLKAHSSGAIRSNALDVVVGP
ncbi:MAG: hypothetical protein JOZ25_07400, partial [Actinobacteria bacterium]|nr:hypothetical protein [Actinomycetota bacterium]